MFRKPRILCDHDMLCGRQEVGGGVMYCCSQGLHKGVACVRVTFSSTLKPSNPRFNTTRSLNTGTPNNLDWILEGYLIMSQTGSDGSGSIIDSSLELGLLDKLEVQVMTISGQVSGLNWEVRGQVSDLKSEVEKLSGLLQVLLAKGGTGRESGGAGAANRGDTSARCPLDGGTLAGKDFVACTPAG